MTTKVMHVITTLGPAGAETMLHRITSAMDRSRFENEVVSLTGILDLAEKVRSTGTRVRSLSMTKAFPNPLLIMRLARWISESKPDVIHTWMYHANLVGTLAAGLAGGVPLIWGIHHSPEHSGLYRRRTQLVNRACALLSRTVADRIICCSESAIPVHENLGYAPGKLQVIPNGFDLRELKPDPAARVSLRGELGVTHKTVLIGIAARFHPQKDHRNFIRAATRIHAVEPDVHFVLCGMDVTWKNPQLVSWIKEAALQERCHLLGPREDVPRIFAGVDIAATSSAHEAFPVVVGEAMACGTPCVVTDVGDSAVMVGPTGLVVPPGNSDALAESLLALIQMAPAVRQSLGIAARDRIEKRFSLAEVVNRYQEVYGSVTANRRSPQCSLTPIVPT